MSDCFVTAWMQPLQAPLSMGFYRQDTGAGSHSLLQGIEPTSLALAARFFTTESLGKPRNINYREAK